MGPTNSHQIMGKSWDRQWKGQQAGRWSSDSTSITSGGETLRYTPPPPTPPPRVFPWPWAISDHDTGGLKKTQLQPTAFTGKMLRVSVDALGALPFQLTFHLLLLLHRKRQRWLPHPLGQKLSWAFLPLTAFATWQEQMEYSWECSLQGETERTAYVLLEERYKTVVL